jgi:hypothetical protein
MGRLLIYLLAAVLFQFALVWVLTHFGLVVLGAGGWWMWSRLSGRSRG